MFVALSIWLVTYFWNFSNFMAHNENKWTFNVYYTTAINPLNCLILLSRILRNAIFLWKMIRIVVSRKVWIFFYLIRKAKKIFNGICYTVVCDWESSRPLLCSKLALFKTFWETLKGVLCCFLSYVLIDMAWGFQMSHFSFS